MSVRSQAAEVFDREFLELRARILEVAAILDRIDRTEGDIGNDPRCQRIAQALAVLSSPRSDRAEQVQLLFSIPYDENWQTALAVAQRR